MTYEKFEYKVLGMLLDGSDPRLERLIAQTWDAEVLTRDETATGINVKFSIPAVLAIKESEGRIFGVEAKLSEAETIHFELSIKDGLIDCLKGTFESEMSYGELVKHYKDFTFSYTNEASSEMSFSVESDDEVVAEILAPISKEVEVESGIEAKDEDQVQDAQAQEVADESLVSEPLTLPSSDEVVHEVRQDASTKAPEKQASRTLDPLSKIIVEPTPPITKTADVMMPPSFSIPKIPSAIKESLEEEEKKEQLKNLTLKELSNPDLKIENPIDIAPEELESEALSAVNIDDVNRSIALMEKKSKELRIITIMIVLVTIITIGFIISMVVNS